MTEVRRRRVRSGRGRADPAAGGNRKGVRICLGGDRADGRLGGVRHGYCSDAGDDVRKVRHDKISRHGLKTSNTSVITKHDTYLTPLPFSFSFPPITRNIHVEKSTP